MTSETLDVGGTTWSIDKWTASARNTYNEASAPAGEWFLYLTDVTGFWSSAYSGSDCGMIDFAPEGAVHLHFRERTGWSPFVVVQLREGMEGVAMEVRYAVSIQSGEHQWSDWNVLPWDAQNNGYVHIGPACDGTIGPEMWGLVEVRSGDTSGFSLMKIRAGWANLGPE